MQRFFAALLGVLIGYVGFAFAGYWVIAFLSDNKFDRSVEAIMTAAFAIGPAGAIIGLVTGVILGGVKRKSVPSQPLE